MSFGGFSFGSSSTAQPANNPSFSLTGATSQPTPGASAAAPAPSFSFGAQPSQNTASGSGGGLFGAQPQQQQQQAGSGGGGLFGGGSLFGAQKTTQPTTNLGGGGLFGSTNQQQQPPQQAGLFGQPSTQSASGGLFGQSSTTQQPSLFGQPQQQQQQIGQTSLFGKPPQQQQQSSSLFGQSTSQQPQQNSLFGQPNQQQNAGALSASTSNQTSAMNKSTKFTDLPDGIQKVIENVDSWIKTQKQEGAGINTEALGRAIWQTSGDVKAANEEYSALSQGLAAIQNSLSQLQVKCQGEEADFRKIAEIWDTFKSVEGRPGAVRVATHREFPQEFFSRVAVGLDERVDRYKKTIAQLHRAIISLSNDHETPSPHIIAQTIHNHQNALITLAAQLEDLQMRMNDLRAHFSKAYMDRTDSMRSPFDVAREEKGMAPLRA